MSDSAPRLSRRELMTLLLGTSVATSTGCTPRPLPPAGELLHPELALGHRIRDGFRPRIAPEHEERAAVVIVGGGIAGLSAAWRLKRAGLDDFLLLEIERECGGTSRSGTRGGFAFPWGAHYVPVPMQENRGLITLLTEMEVVVGTHDDGSPRVAEQFLCRDPQERVFSRGRWSEGLYPYRDASDDDRMQLEQFQAAINRWVNRRDEHGRRMFAIPIAQGSDCEQVTSLDRISMFDWMDSHGFSSPRLQWLVDHACRDDYGLTIEQTSAWAGLFYFASRARTMTQASQEVITWPAGNGSIVSHLVDRVGGQIRPGTGVCHIQLDPQSERPTRLSGWSPSTDRPLGVSCEQLIFAAPQFMAPYLIEDFERLTARSVKAFEYGAWMVANLHLRDRPHEDGFPMCWDNVIYQSKSLGYVSATHQTGADHGATVITWYYPLSEHDGKISRQQLLGMTWADWAEIIIADLSQPHPDIAPLITRMDIMSWGHAMIQPRPGFVWSRERREAVKPVGNLHFAGTDLSGVALMEEAFYHGVRAAEEVLAKRAHPFESIL
ncbi:MAG: flavin monoamine oxidase family protein [Novipirellula sp. JB048]